jgi:hypothetical protein
MKDRYKWWICGLWFMHDFSPLDYRCQNCGVPLWALVMLPETPCLEHFLRTMERRILNGRRF